jgi:hypothetical protein
MIAYPDLNLRLGRAAADASERYQRKLDLFRDESLGKRVNAS